MADDSASPWSRLMLPALLCLTLGLAPFTPEPHIVGKLRWIAGGADGMGPMDWFDVVLHGTPWVFLLGTLVSVLRDVAGSGGAEPGD